METIPLAPGYEFGISDVVPGVVKITLVQKSTNLEKTFVKHGVNTAMEKAGLGHHMRSLTDTQCADWFKAMKRVS